MTTPNDMPDRTREFSKTEERRLRSRTSKRLVLLSHKARTMSGDELLALHEHIDNFWDELNGYTHHVA